jgi:hypothetical protein
MSFNFYIREYPNALSPEFCEAVIAKFDADERVHNGMVAGGYYPEVKQSQDLNITHFDGWDEEDAAFQESLGKHLQIYSDTVMEKCIWGFSAVRDTGYQIQRTQPGGFYTWHNDCCALQGDVGFVRDLTFIWYLNTIHDGGTTEFITGEKIQPEQGKLLIFPSNWVFAHRGNPPVSEVKYLCTGWVYNRY